MSPYFSMPFTQSQKTNIHEPLQGICSATVGASAGRKTNRASAPTIAQIVVIIFAFITIIFWLNFAPGGGVAPPEPSGDRDCVSIWP